MISPKNGEKMTLRKFLFLLPVLMLILVGCQPANTVSVAGRETTVTPPESGKAHIAGQVISNVSNEGLGLVTVRLAQVYETNDESDAFILDGARSPGAVADENGYFVVENVDPVRWVLVIGDVTEPDEHEIIPDDKGHAAVWEPAEGEVLDVGVIRVSLAPGEGQGG